MGGGRLVFARRRIWAPEVALPEGLIESSEMKICKPRSGCLYSCRTDKTILYNLFSAAMGISITARRGLRVIGDAEQALDIVLMGRNPRFARVFLRTEAYLLCSFFL